MRKECNDFFIATGTSETLKKKNQKKIDKERLCPIEVEVFANWQNLYILFLWNQKSQEADIQDYEIS